MKKLGLSVAALAVALSAAQAFAADLPSKKAPPYIPPPPPPPMWTGFYVGLNAGGTWNANNNISVFSAPTFWNPLFPAAPLFSSAAAAGATGVLSATNGGFIGGGQIGYNWQFNNVFVAGLEADIQGVAANHSNATSLAAVPVFGPFNAVTTLSVSKSLDYLGTVRGRIGYLFTPTLLAYATGGLAYGGVNLNLSGFQGIVPDFFPFATAGFGSSAFSDTRVGWTVGGGLEWMFWPNWSAKVEYLYYDLGSIQTPALPTIRTLAGTPLWANATTATSRFDGHIVRAGVNYHFNWGAPAPVVAKY